ncbi:MAG: SRPBCC family protein [Capnocytophaga ochracea]
MKPFLISIVTDVINAPIALVYNIVTDNKNFQWRKEVENIELLEDGFIEYYKGGGHTFFKNIQKKENEYYAFIMQHKLFNGEWEGKFESYNGGTKVCFQEKIHIKNFFLRLIAPLFWNLKRIQQNYITALKAEVYGNK